jgi:hypothetical protein
VPPNPKLLEAAYELLGSGQSDLYTIGQIYDYIESNVEMTPFERELHSPNSDPNWKHDTRNLLGGEKRKVALINPLPKTWGFPREYRGPHIDHDLCFRNIVNRAQNELGSIISGAVWGSNFTIQSIGENEIKIEYSNGKKYTVSESLVMSRVKHLQLCGGAVKSGNFHRWRGLETAIVTLHPCIEYDAKNELIFIQSADFKNLIRSNNFEMDVTRWLLKEIERMNTSTD